MRYATPPCFVVFLLAELAVISVHAQQVSEPARRPGLFSEAVSTLSQDASADVEDPMPPASQETPNTDTWSGPDRGTQLPQASNDGTITGSTVTQRMNSIRRRAVDSNIGAQFFAEPQELKSEVASKGQLPAVKRRALGSMPVPSQSGETSQSTRRQTSDIEVSGRRRPNEPTPAAWPQPTLAAGGPPAVSPSNAQPMQVQPIPSGSIGAVSRAAANADNVLLTNQAPALSFETAGPRQIVIGKEATYRVTMVNLGGVDAHNVICTVQLPAWAEIISNTSSVGTPQTEADGDQHRLVRWEIAHLPAHGRESLTLNIVLRDGRPFDLAVGWAFAPGQTTAQIEVQEPKLELTLNGSEEVEYGETDTYTITISNPGTGDAENVVLNLLPMTAHQQIAGTRNMGTIAAGQRKTVELELTAHQAGRLQVKAMAYADNGLRAEVSQDVVVRRANLEVVVMGPPRNYAATAAAYKVRVENTGNAMATDAVAVAALPAGARYLSSTDGGRFDSQRSQVQWHIGSLRSGAVRVLEMQCELNSSGENRVDIQCQSSHDLSVTKSVVTMVEALADLKLYVNDPQGAIATGDEAEYEIRIVNRGTKAAENIQLVGYFSDGVEPETIRGGRGEITTGQVVLEPIESIAAGQELVFRISARAHQPGNHVFRAELQCRSPETRLATEEWTKYYVGSGGARQARAEAPSSSPGIGTR